MSQPSRSEDERAALERLEAWYASPKGAFALARKQRMLSTVIAPWQRRYHSLLEIGCGSGLFLKQFYSGGFDVTGVDKNEAMLDKARRTMGNKVTLRNGDATRLPFDDGQFDYTALVTSLEYMDKPEEVLREAFRVATHGLVIAFTNAWSLLRLEQLLSRAYRRIQRRFALSEKSTNKFFTGKADILHWYNVFSLCRAIYVASGLRPTAIHSTLFAPSAFWWGKPLFTLPWVSLLPFGAVTVVRVDIIPLCPTPLVLRTKRLTESLQYTYSGYHKNTGEFR